MQKLITSLLMLLSLIAVSKADEYQLLFQDTLKHHEEISGMAAPSINEIYITMRGHNAANEPLNLYSYLIRSRDMFKTSDTLLKQSWRLGDTSTSLKNFYRYSWITYFSPQTLICEDYSLAKLYKSTDLGKSWKTYIIHNNKDTSKSTFLINMLFSDSLHICRLQSNLDTLYYSNDCGETWLRSPFSRIYEKLDYSIDAFSIGRIKNNKYWFSCGRGTTSSGGTGPNYGTPSSKSIILISDDSAQNWKYYVGPDFVNLGTPLFLDENNGFSVAAIIDSMGQIQYKDSVNMKVAVYKTKDGGISWEKVYQSKYHDYQTGQLQIMDGKYLFATNSYGYLISSDWGVTWQSGRFDPQYKPFEFRFFKNVNEALVGNGRYKTIGYYKRGPTSVLEGAREESALAYPNPATSDLRVVINENLMDKNYSLSIYNSMGEKIKEISAGAVGDKYLQLDVSDLASGAYFLRIDTQDASKNVAFVVSR